MDLFCQVNSFTHRNFTPSRRLSSSKYASQPHLISETRSTSHQSASPHGSLSTMNMYKFTGTQAAQADNNGFFGVWESVPSSNGFYGHMSPQGSPPNAIEENPLAQAGQSDHRTAAAIHPPPANQVALAPRQASGADLSLGLRPARNFALAKMLSCSKWSKTSWPARMRQTRARTPGASRATISIRQRHRHTKTARRLSTTGPN